MSKTFKIYVFVFFVGIALAAWSANKWKNTVDRRYEAANAEPRKVKAPEPTNYDNAYDRSGRLAAIRVYPQPSSAEQRQQPLFWAKGNLVTIEKDDWSSTALQYSRRDISRDILHTMIDAIALLAKEPAAASDLEITRTLPGGSQERFYAAAGDFRTMLAAWMGSREKSPYVLQSLDLFAQETQLQPSQDNWPIRLVPLGRLVRAGQLTVRKKSHVRRIQDVITAPRVYSFEEKAYLVSAVARVDR